MAALGLLFLVIVVSERMIEPREPLNSVLSLTSWAIWAAFVAEFAWRVAAAPSKKRFLLRDGWQAVLLLLPFLNVLRGLAAVRLTRVGRALSAGVRATRTARANLAGRLGWVVTLTVTVIIVAADILYQFSGFTTYSSALHAAALATITGRPTEADSGTAQVLEVLLAAYSVVVFAALAGTAGAYFLGDRSSSDVPKAPVRE